MPAAVVDDGLLFVLGQRLDVFQDIFDGLFQPLGAGQGIVQVVHVSLVVLAVVNLYRLGVDVRFERIDGIGQSRQREAFGHVAKYGFVQQSCAGHGKHFTAVHQIVLPRVYIIVHDISFAARFQ